MAKRDTLGINSDNLDNPMALTPPDLINLVEFLDGLLAKLHHQAASDAISECGTELLEQLKSDPKEALRVADAKLRVFPFKDVQLRWRRLFEDASLAVAARCMIQGIGINSSTLEKGGSSAMQYGIAENESGSGASASPGDPGWLTDVVRLLDMAIIMTGAPERSSTIADLFTRLECCTSGKHAASELDHVVAAPARKRRRLSASSTNSSDYEFPASASVIRSPMIQYPIPRQTGSFDLPNGSNQSACILTDAISYWPALADPQRRWSRPSYFLSRTLGGRRLVPVELGRSYTDEGWGQKIMPFGDFLDKHILPHEKGFEEHGIGYLAQHDLLAQIPALRADVAVPDAVWEALESDSDGEEDADVRGIARVEMVEPLLNTWFGPAGTISPLHTDPYDNVLCQVVGKKYIRLYAPDQTPKMFPRGKEKGTGVGESGGEDKEVDMSNTSSVPVEVVEMGAAAAPEEIVVGEDEDDENYENDDDADDDSDEKKNKWAEFENAPYVETILAEGEALFIPRGWWHYVRSLTVSVSVSFWWK